MNEAVKGGLVLAAVIVLFVMLAVFSSWVNALTIECKNPRTFIEMHYNEGGEECPPAVSCQEGYSCQKDKPNEQQLSPTPAASAWLDSVVAGPLVQIPLDDKRWGGRVAGEVYGLENNDFIVFYWPQGGNAVFDTTKLGQQAYWRDYRIKSGVSSGGPHTSLSTGKKHAIRFWDAGGGLTVFGRK